MFKLKEFSSFSANSETLANGSADCEREVFTCKWISAGGDRTGQGARGQVILPVQVCQENKQIKH